MPAKAKLTPEQRRENILAAKRRYNEKKKLERQANSDNFERLYLEERAKNENLVKENESLKQLCKSYATSAEVTERNLQRATLEYNARTKYMLDCVKHAYTSMQFSVNAIEPKGGEQ